MSSPNPVSRQDARKRQTSGALVAAAEELFADRALHEVTVDQIAARAHVSVGSLYAHFGSKEALYLRVVDNALSLGDDYLSSRAWSASPLERVVSTGQAYVNFALEHPAAFRLTTAQVPEIRDVPDIQEIEAQISRRVRGAISRLSSDLEDAVQAGELDPFPVRHILAYLWASWSGVIAMALRDDEFQIARHEVRPLLDCAASVLSRGAGAAPAGQAVQLDG